MTGLIETNALDGSCGRQYYPMKNKTQGKFRMKEKIPRETCISVDHPRRIPSETQEEEPSRAFGKHGFSSEYLSLARRFKISILAHNNQQRSPSRDVPTKTSKLRLKTEMSRLPRRYPAESPIQMLDAKPHSLSIPDRTVGRPFFMGPRSTALSTQIPQGKAQDLQLLGIQPETGLKLTSKQLLMNLCNHCRKLLAVKTALQGPGRQSQGGKAVIREIKLYVLRQEECSISRLDRCFADQPTQKQIRKLVIFQRLALVAIIVNFLTSKLSQQVEECSRVLEIVLGFWFEVISNTYKQHIYDLETEHSQVRDVMKILAEARLLTKSSLPLLIETVLQKLPLLYRYARDMWERVKLLAGLSEDLSINRAFYELLGLLAAHITNSQAKLQVSVDTVNFFATCPSPYLVRPATKPRSLVIDLDGTLLFSKPGPSGRLETLYRPGCHEFLQAMAPHFEIIVFTTSLQAYARDVTKDFKHIDHFLFRQHAVRVRHGFVKDLSRIGRDLKKVVMLDDLSSNFKLQKENGVKVASWHGQQGDSQLSRLQEVLLKIAGSQSQDIKSELHSYRGELQRKRVSFSTTPYVPKDTTTPSI